MKDSKSEGRGEEREFPLIPKSNGLKVVQGTLIGLGPDFDIEFITK